MSDCRHFIIHGRVQGVFFRASARDRALALDLSGWVRNLPDGRVEALACGGQSALDAFQAWLGAGPAAANVTRVQAEPGEDRGIPSGFSIR
jgi:acylphosphatase